MSTSILHLFFFTCFLFIKNALFGSYSWMSHRTFIQSSAVTTAFWLNQYGGRFASIFRRCPPSMFWGQWLVGMKIAIPVLPSIGSYISDDARPCVNDDCFDLTAFTYRKFQSQKKKRPILKISHLLLLKGLHYIKKKPDNMSRGIPLANIQSEGLCWRWRYRGVFYTLSG